MSVILQRLRYHRGEAIALWLAWLAIALTGFIVPAYWQTASESYLTREVDALTPRDRLLEFQNPVHFADGTLALINDILEETITRQDSMWRTAGLAPSNEPNFHQAFALPHPDRHIRLIDGQMPDPQADAPQVLLSSVVSRRAELKIGDTFNFTTDDTAPTLEVVGIFEAINPDDRYWQFHIILLDGVETPVGTRFRFDFGFIVAPQVFTDTIMPLSPEDVISQEVYTDALMTTPARAAERYQTLRRLERDFLQLNPQGDVITSLTPALDELLTRLDSVQSQMQILLGGGMLLLAGLVVITARVFRMRLYDWELMTRTGYRRAFIRRIYIPMLLLIALVAAGAGAIGAGLLASLTWSGLLIALSVSLLTVGLVVAMPQDDTTDNPFILRANFDGLLLAVAAVLLARELVFADVALLTPQTVLQQIADNLLIALVAAAGLGILLLRVLSGVFPAIKSRSYAIWAVLLLLMTGAGAAGGSYALDTYRWQEARWQTGGNVQIPVDPGTGASSIINDLPYAGVAHYQDTQNPNRPVNLIGLQPDAFSTMFPAYASRVDALQSAELPSLPGLELPDDAQALSVAVAANRQWPDDIKLQWIVRDARGVITRLPLDSRLDTPPEEFQTYTVDLPSTAHPPYRLTDFDIQTRDLDDLTIYLDTITLTMQDGTASVLQDFDTPAESWRLQTGLPDGLSDALSVTNIADSGRVSFRLTLEATPVASVRVPVNPPVRYVIPAVVSDVMAAQLGGRNNRTITPGTETDINLRMATGVRTLRLRAVDIISDFPTLNNEGRFVVMPLQPMLFALNDHADRNLVYDVNEIWLDAPADTLDKATLPDSAQFATVRYEALTRNILPTVPFVVLWIVFIVGLPTVCIATALSRSIRHKHQQSGD